MSAQPLEYIFEGLGDEFTSEELPDGIRRTIEETMEAIKVAQKVVNKVDSKQHCRARNLYLILRAEKYLTQLQVRRSAYLRQLEPDEALFSAWCPSWVPL